LETKSEPFVKEGKEKAVGYWLLFFSFSVALMIAVGGYTRLSKSGLSMVRWKPINYKLPHSLEEWNVEFESYKVTILSFFISAFNLSVSNIQSTS
jgi:heme a synthase